jgi:hypothetical protein
MFTKHPSNLYRFYKEESSFYHAESFDTPPETIVGIEKIKQKISELTTLIDGTGVDLKEGTVDAQKTENDAVLLVVTGSFTHPTLGTRPFMQNFVLASQINPSSGQANTGASYYVRNSVFRLLPQSSVVVEKLVERVVTPLPTPAEPVHIPVAVEVAQAHVDKAEEAAQADMEANVWNQVSEVFF